MDEQVSEPTQRQIMVQLTQALSDSRQRTETQLATLERKIDDLSKDLIATEATLRRELQTQFITRVEYEPRHLMLQQAVDVLNKATSEISTLRDRVIVLEQVSMTGKIRADQLEVQINTLDTRERGAVTRAIPWIATAISLIGLATQLLQHVQIR